MGWHSASNRDMFVADLKLTPMKAPLNKIIISILASFALCMNANAISDALKVKISSGSTTDETVIRFLPTASTGFDGSYDAYKLFSTSPTVPAIYTRLDSVTELSINALPSFTAQNNVPLYTHIKVAGNYTLQSIELGTGFQPNIEITLEDLETGMLYSFRNGQSVTLPMTVNTVASHNRFVVHVSPPMTVTVSDATCHGSGTGSVIVSKPGNSSWNCQLKDAAGTLVNAVSGINESVQIDNLFAGSYTIYTSSSSSLPDSAAIMISEPAAAAVLSASFTTSGDTVLLSQATIQFTNTSTSAVYYSWDFGDGIGTDSVSPFHQYTSSGVFTVSLVVADSAGNSTSYSKIITVTNDLTTGIADLDQAATTQAYQYDGALQIRLRSVSAAGMTVEVYNSLGQSIAAFSAGNSTSLSESVYLPSSGTYIVRSFINNKVSSQQISFIK